MGSKGTNIELVCTENNSVSSNPGKQSVSLVNGLFKIDTLAQLMQTEFNGLFWWNLQNGGVSDGGDMDSSLYGWRLYGDYGVMEGTTLFPPYYTTELMTHFAQTGDTVITATSDYSTLPVYAVRRLDGSLTVLVINKDSVNTHNAQISVAGFTPASGAVIYSYGIPQDDAAEYGTGSPDIAQTNISLTGTNITHAFPPYSATVLALSPAPAKLLAVAPPPAANHFVFQLQGQAGVPYVVERSTNLVTWTPVSTNTLASSTMNITNALAPSAAHQFWRVVWKP
jgi:hypothetical protein